MDSIKTYLVEVIARKAVPAAVASALAALGTYLIAHASILEQWGITYGIWPLTWPANSAPSGPVILIELDTLKVQAAVGIVSLVGVLMALLTHHTSATVTGAPQSGDKRTVDLPVTNGQRKDDPK